MRTTHELKTWPEFFEQTRNGLKRFELRRNDRDFKVGDHLLLKEWMPPRPLSETKAALPGIYTGRELLARVDYIMDVITVARLTGLLEEPGPDEICGLPAGGGCVIMSVSLVH